MARSQVRPGPPRSARPGSSISEHGGVDRQDRAVVERSASPADLLVPALPACRIETARRRRRPRPATIDSPGTRSPAMSLEQLLGLVEAARAWPATAPPAVEHQQRVEVQRARPPRRGRGEHLATSGRPRRARRPRRASGSCAVDQRRARRRARAASSVASSRQRRAAAPRWPGRQSRDERRSGRRRSSSASSPSRRAIASASSTSASRSAGVEP